MHIFVIFDLTLKNPGNLINSAALCFSNKEPSNRITLRIDSYPFKFESNLKGS